MISDCSKPTFCLLRNLQQVVKCHFHPRCSYVTQPPLAATMRILFFVFPRITVALFIHNYLQTRLKGYSAVFFCFFFVVPDLPETLLSTPTNIAAIVFQISGQNIFVSREFVEYTNLVLTEFLFKLKVSPGNNEKVTAAAGRGVHSLDCGICSQLLTSSFPL